MMFMSIFKVSHYRYAHKRGTFYFVKFEGYVITIMAFYRACKF